MSIENSSKLPCYFMFLMHIYCYSLEFPVSAIKHTNYPLKLLKLSYNLQLMPAESFIRVCQNFPDLYISLYSYHDVHFDCPWGMFVKTRIATLQNFVFTDYFLGKWTLSSPQPFSKWRSILFSLAYLPQLNTRTQKLHISFLASYVFLSEHFFCAVENRMSFPDLNLFFKFCLHRISHCAMRYAQSYCFPRRESVWGKSYRTFVS